MACFALSPGIAAHEGPLSFRQTVQSFAKPSRREAKDVAPVARVNPKPNRKMFYSPALTWLLLLAAMYTLYFAKVVLLPFALAVLLNFIFVPVIRGLRRLHIPEAAGAALVLAGVVAVFGYSFYLLSQPAATWVQRVPEVMDRLQQKISVLKRPVEQVNAATEQMEKLATVGGSKPAPTVELKSPWLGGALFTITRAFITQALILFVLLYFLLASGDLFLRKLIRILPRLQDKRVAVEIARQIQEDISVYLLTVTIINTCLGAVVAAVLFPLGIPNAVLWGVMAGVLNFIPYIGPSISVTVIAMVAVLSFDHLSYAVLPPLAFLALVIVEGNFVTPYVLGRRLTLNPVAIVIGLVFWAWIWGIFGALVAVPTLVIIKIFCDHVDPLAPVGEFLAG